MEFLDRTAELKRLEALSTRPSGGFAVIWGRRRVGKTRLLLEWVRRKGGVYFVADQSAAPLQRRALAEALGSRLPGFAEVVYPDWTSLLSRAAVEAARLRWSGQGPEWDVVSLSLDGKHLLLGEAKWRRKQAGSQLFDQASKELTAKGVPQGLLKPGTTVHHVLFFPLPSQDKMGAGTQVMGAHDVIGALGGLN